MISAGPWRAPPSQMTLPSTAPGRKGRALTLKQAIELASEETAENNKRLSGSNAVVE